MMIEHQKQILRSNHGLAEKSETLQKPQKQSSHTTKAYIELIQKEEDEQVKNDYKQILKIFDSRTWGNDTTLSQWAKDYSKKWGYRCEESTLVIATHFFFNKDFLLSRKSGLVPTLQELKKIMESYAFITSLEESLKEPNDFFLFKRLEKKSFLNANLWRAAINYYLSGKMNSDIPRLLSDPTSIQVNIETQMQKLLRSEDQKFFTTKEEIYKEIQDSLELFSCLTPLPDINSKSETSIAYKILGVSSNESEVEIKKRYKKLAKDKHPDTLKSKGISSEYEQLANENFVKLQIAYDIIKKDFKNASK